MVVRLGFVGKQCILTNSEGFVSCVVVFVGDFSGCFFKGKYLVVSGEQMKE